MGAAGVGADRRKLWLPVGAVCLSEQNCRAGLSGFRRMSKNLPSRNDPRYAVWIGVTAILFFLALAVGFVWLPSAQSGAAGLDLWSAICRAVGLPSGPPKLGTQVEGQPASLVAWTVATRRKLTLGDAEAGAAAASTCNNCHGNNGTSSDAIIPNLAG